MPFITFIVRRGLSAVDKSRISEAMSEAQWPLVFTELMLSPLSRGRRMMTFS